MIKNHRYLIFISCIIYSNCFSQTENDTSLNLYFETNSYALDSNQYKKLLDFTSAYSIQSIIGYADTTGSKAYNVSLSKKRAFAAYTIINGGRLLINERIVLSTGESAEEPELWKNRRVQIKANQRVVSKTASNTIANAPIIIRTFNVANVFFIPDQAIITEESLAQIQQLADILKTYTTETFEIIGHVNYQSRFDSSHLTDIYQLSERRAKAVYDLLQEFGIPANSMNYKGVGNSQPIFPSPINNEQKSKNMRVQIVIKK